MKEELPERYFYTRRKVVKISQVLKEIFPKRKPVDRIFFKIQEMWPSIIGEDIYAVTKVTNLKNRILYVTVESPAIIHHLTNFEQPAIINRINNILGNYRIEEIRFKIGCITDD